MSDVSDVEEAPPSSPPHFSLPSRKRARNLHNEDVNTSSDPPLFSSDPVDPSIDNYGQNSRKRQYRGVWWGQQVKSSRQSHKAPIAKSPFARNLDSGVWMGSDSSDDATSYEPPSQKDVDPAESLPAVSRNAFRSSLTAGRSAALNVAYQIVNVNADLDGESVDLSGLDLGVIPADLLSPLRLVTKQAGFLRCEDSPKDEDFEPLHPELQLYMQQNALRKLPAELWNLENLTVLSLRQNKLTSIPASIGRLRNLRELNLACNRLRYLPWELLNLITGDGGPIRNGPIRNLTVSPNPFFRAVFHPSILGTASKSGYGLIDTLRDRKLDFGSHFEEQMRSAATQEEYRNAAWSKKLHQYYHDLRKRKAESSDEIPFSWHDVQPLYMSSTPVIYLDIDGSPLSSNCFPLVSRIPYTDDSLLFTNPFDDSQESSQSVQGTWVPSLFELSTSMAKKALFLSELHTLLPENTPAPIFRALDLAKAVKEEEGERVCSICKRSYVIPRTEWVEFWHKIPVNLRSSEFLTDISMDELFLPFLRHGCSWRCIPT